jgi:3-oxoacyl-[acyl-carrier-protein] synthase III
VSQQLHRVSITGTGSYLPGEPIPNDRLDEVLGPLDQAPERIQAFVKNIASRMLASSGIEYRHFAIDPATHKLTHTVASLAEESARLALAAAGRQPQDIELLLLSCPNYDCSTPPTSTILQERLGIKNCAEMEIHSNCSGVGKCMQVAFDALRCGRYKRALVAYSQLSSVYLRNCYFNQPRMNKNQAALRYILADGSGAVLLEAVEPGTNHVQHELLGTYVESVGGDLPAGMTAGGGVADLVDAEHQIPDVYELGTHHLDQDFSAVNRSAGRLLFDGVVRMAHALGIDPKCVDGIVASIPTRQLYEDNVELFTEYFGLTREQARFRARNTGYCGGSSILLHFDEMVREGEIRPGQTVLLDSVESSKWMTAGFAVRW